MSDPAQHLGLLIVDLQPSLLKKIPNAAALVSRVQFAVSAAEILGVQIACTEQAPKKLGATIPAVVEKVSGELPTFEKTAFSAFEAAGIERWIEANQIDHLLLAGVETPICIYQTAIAAMGKDIGVTLLSDCIGCRRPADAAPVIQQLLTIEAMVLPSETIFYSLAGDSAHRSFSALTQLSKEFDANQSIED